MENKKQAFNLIEAICKQNEVAWGNPKGTYDDATESAYQIEEALEGLKDLPYLATRLHPDGKSHVENFTPKECSRQIVKLAMMDDKTNSSDVDRFDKALDAIYFAVGSLHKLGLDPEHIVEGLAVVHTANSMKGSAKDSEGKILKPEAWDKLYAPEPKLEQILAKRKVD